ncbi:MAG: DUF58 domain-containing protein [Acidimicrobiales bacterium]|nr:DUF58 domain-containing protein [Acidimicrobiales bacterium]
MLTLRGIYCLSLSAALLFIGRIAFNFELVTLAVSLLLAFVGGLGASDISSRKWKRNEPHTTLLVEKRLVCQGETVITTVELLARFGLSRVVAFGSPVSESRQGRFVLRPKMFLDYIPANSRYGIRSKIRARSRGKMTIGPVEFWRLDPFGLTAHYLTSSLTTEVLVYPNLSPIEVNSSGLEKLTVAGNNYQKVKEANSGDTPFGFKPWRPGESIERVHWPLSIKSSSVMLRTFERPAERVVEIVIDNSIVPEFLSRQSYLVDRIADISGSLALSFLKSGKEVTISTIYGPKRVLQPNQRESELTLLAILAGLEGRTRIDGLGISRYLSEVNKRNIVLVTSDPTLHFSRAQDDVDCLGAVFQIVLTERNSNEFFGSVNEGRFPKEPRSAEEDLEQIRCKNLVTIPNDVGLARAWWASKVGPN